MLMSKVHSGVEAVFEEEPSKIFNFARSLGAPNERGNEIHVWSSHEGAIRMLGGEVMTSE